MPRSFCTACWPAGRLPRPPRRPQLGTALLVDCATPGGRQLSYCPERPALQELEAAGGMDHDAGEDLGGLQRQAASRQREFDRAAREAAAAGGFTDYSRRAFFKEFVKVPGDSIGS